MKRFRFAASHLVMIGVIIFGILAISTRVFRESPALMLIIFLVCAVVVGLLYYQKEVYEISELEQIELLNNQTEDNLITLLEKMPVGVVQFDPNDDKIEWFNPYAELIFTQDDGEFDTDFVMTVIEQQRQGAAHKSIEVGDNKYSIYIDFESGMFYFFNIWQEIEAAHQETAHQSVIGIISIDNYDDIIGALPDAEVSQINSFIANFISEFSKTNDIFYRRVNMDRFYFFTDYPVLEELIASKFELLERFRKAAQELDLALTLSMGIAYGAANHSQIGQLALKNLNIALVRGGDQAVVRENSEDAEAVYFGGGSVSTVKRSRTRTRAMMTAISDKIKQADQVFIVGHKNLDMDALGASVAMQVFAENLIDKSYAVYDPMSMNHDIQRAVSSLQKAGERSLLTVDEALAKRTKRSLLIMVDHSRLSLTLSKELYEGFKEVVIVDHHRRSEDFPENAIISFIESGASSACELVTELLQFQNAKTRLTKLQASLVMAGIMLDTKNFSSGVTSRTFDVASYLRSLGSDSTTIQTISALDFEEYRQTNELILAGQKIGDAILVAKGQENRTYSNVISSKAANTLLNMAGIEASFVITKTPKNQVAVSARSHSKINVQRIMEVMGGGGHFNLAACQLDGETVESVYQQLLTLLSEELKETKER